MTHSNRTFAFTKRRLAELRSSANSLTKQVEFTDSQEPALKLVLYPSGTMRYFLRTTWKKRKHVDRLGDVESIGLPDARSAARQFRADVQLGRDPQRERQRDALTFDQLAADYVCVNQEVKRSIRDDQSRLRTHLLPAFGSCSVTGITVQQVESFHRGLCNSHSPATANRCLMLMRSIYGHGHRSGSVDDSAHPAREVRPAQESNERGTFLLRDQVPTFMAGLQQLQPDHAALFELLLLTGMRSSECVNLHTTDLRLDQKLVHLSQTKNGGSRDVPLSDRALAIIQQQIATHGAGPLFPGRDLSKSMSFPRRAWQQLMQLCGLKLTPHDLRRTYISFALEHAPLERIAANVGHRDIRTTHRRYLRHDPDDLRSCAQGVADLIGSDNN